MKTKVISVRLNEEEFALLDEITDDIGVRVSDYIRACLRIVTDFRQFQLKQSYESGYGEDDR